MASLAEPRRNRVAPGIDHSESQTSPPECDRFHDDIAVSAVGALDGVEFRRLLRHLDECPHCEAVREEYAATARALETLMSVGTEWWDLSHRVMDSIRSSATNRERRRPTHQVTDEVRRTRS